MALDLTLKDAQAVYANGAEADLDSAFSLLEQ